MSYSQHDQMVVIGVLRFVRGRGARSIRQKVMDEYGLTGHWCPRCKRFKDPAGFADDRERPGHKYHTCKRCERRKRSRR